MKKKLNKIKEDIEDFYFILRCVFSSYENNPIRIVKLLEKEREDRIFEELLEKQRKTLEIDHEKNEVEEMMKETYPSILRERAKVLVTDFLKSTLDKNEYLDNCYRFWKEGKITKLEYLHKRSHLKMTDPDFFFRIVSYFAWPLSFVFLIIFCFL